MTMAVTAPRTGFRLLDLAAFRANRARRKLFKTTYNELSALSNRDLDDIGVARGEIFDIAYQHAYNRPFAG